MSTVPLPLFASPKSTMSPSEPPAETNPAFKRKQKLLEARKKTEYPSATLSRVLNFSDCDDHSDSIDSIDKKSSKESPLLLKSKTAEISPVPVIVRLGCSGTNPQERMKSFQNQLDLIG